MSSVDKEYYEYLDKLSKDALIRLVMNTEMLALKQRNERIKELGDGIKVRDGLIEQLENQNDRLIEQRDNYEQQLENYKGALELACASLEERDTVYQYFKKNRRTKEEYLNMFIDQVKKEKTRKIKRGT